MNEKLLVYGGKIWTGDAKVPHAEAFLVEGGRFTAVGSKEYVESKAHGTGVERIDARGSLVIPGITDAHMHLSAYCKQGLYLDLSDVDSIDALLAKLKRYVEEQKDCHWVRAFGYNETLWAEPVTPTMEMIDAVSGDHAVLVSRYCGHVHVAGRRAIEEAGLWDAQDENIVRGNDGQPSGTLNEGAPGPILERIKEESETRERLLALAEERMRTLASMGITAVHACDVPSYGLPEDISLFQDLHEAGKLPIRVMAYHDRFPNLSFRSGMGNDRICYAGYKLFADGNLGGHTSAMREDYADKPGSRGQFTHSDDEFFERMREAQARDIQVQIHMIGDAAIDQSIRVAQRLMKEFGRRPKLPIRFNHVIVSPPDQLPAMQELGVVLDIQPIQAFTDRNMAPARLGAERLKSIYAFRRLYDSGLLVVGSSDGPMENPNPWLGMWAAVCRTDEKGNPLPGQKADEVLTFDEALTIYTKNAYEAIGWKGYGLIAEGAKADFAILENDPYKEGKQRIRDIKVRNTYLEGTKTF